MKIRFVIVIVFMLLCFALISSDEAREIDVEKGKNIIMFNMTEPFYVKTLFNMNENIESVSFQINNKSIGYVRAFGGVGENFIIYPDKEYEVIVSKNTTIIV